MFTNGGTMNGTTNKDRTLYYETLPSNQLDLALFLEADRMRSLEITKENLDNQRNAVQEERRLGVDNQPYGQTFEVVDELAYDNSAYEHSVIGSMADLNAATVDDVAAFFKTYYAPNNAVLVDRRRRRHQDDAREGAQVLRADSRRSRRRRKVDMTEPPQTAERRQTIDDALARLPRIDIAYKVPPSSSPDDDALDVLATVLSSGRSSRFYEAIVRAEAAGAERRSRRSRRSRAARACSGSSATVAPGKTPAELEAAIDAEIEKVKTGPIEDWEIEKARNGARSQVIAGLGSSLQRAMQLGEYALFYDNPDLINTRADEIAKVTAADVQRVARTVPGQDRPHGRQHGAEAGGARQGGQ